jgi:hypothetical protein
MEYRTRGLMLARLVGADPFLSSRYRSRID